MSDQSFQLSELEVRSFLMEPRQFGLPFRRYLLWVAACLGITALSYGLLNFSSLLQVSQPIQVAPVVTTATPQPTQAKAGVAAPTPVPTPSLPSIPDNSVSVPSISLSAPVSWNVPLDNQTIQDKLKNGVIQIGGTALPGQKGMVVITGHSSNYPWIQSSYNSIFASLGQLKTGDQILVNNQGKEYTYTVSKSYVTEPTNLSVLTDQSSVGLRLVTCWPIGTSWHRIVVEAIQTSPNPSTNTPFGSAGFSQTQLPDTK